MNRPMIRTVCTGCRWEHNVDPAPFLGEGYGLWGGCWGLVRNAFPHVDGLFGTVRIDVAV